MVIWCPSLLWAGPTPASRPRLCPHPLTPGQGPENSSLLNNVHPPQACHSPVSLAQGQTFVVSCPWPHHISNHTSGLTQVADQFLCLYSITANSYAYFEAQLWCSFLQKDFHDCYLLSLISDGPSMSVLTKAGAEATDSPDTNYQMIHQRQAPWCSGPPFPRFQRTIIV